MAQIDSQIKFLNLDGLQTYDQKIKEYIGGEINKLDYTINVNDHTAGKAVVGVTQTDGIIAVTEGTVDSQYVTVSFTGQTPVSNTTNVQASLNEIYDKLATNAEAGAIAVYDGATKASAISADGKTYTLKQGTATIATINIAKDMVVSGGSVITAKAADKAIDDAVVIDEKYIKLTLANSTDVLYIAVKDLYDDYTFSGTDEIVFTETNQTVTAAINPKSIAKNKLTDDVQNEISAAATQVSAKSTGHVRVSVTAASGATPAQVTITENDIASATDLSTEVARAQAAELEIAGKIGLTGTERNRVYSTSVGGASVVADITTLNTRLTAAEGFISNMAAITNGEINDLFV